MKLRAAFVLVGVLGLGNSVSSAQDEPRVQREQSEILRRAERLRGLIASLLKRYEAEGRVEQARLLREGLSHLDASALLADVAAVRQSLDSGAWSDALRRQGEIVSDLEALLNILLERRSVESLEQEIATTEELIEGARELARREEELQQRTRDARDSEASAEERRLREELRSLARELERESAENRRQAGMRRPTLEGALDSVQRLLRDQAQLETRLDSAGQPAPSRQQAFALGESEQAQKDALARRNEQLELERLAAQIQAMREALANGDRQLARTKRDQVQAALESLDNRSAAEGRVDPEHGRAARRLAENAAEDVGATGERATEQARALDELGRELEAELRARAEAAAQAASEAQARLAEQLDQLAGALARGDDAARQRQAPAARGAQRAAEALRGAVEAEQNEDPARALAQASEALRQTEEARRALRDADPDARSIAQRMAANADQTAQQLRNARSEADAEQDAAAALERAEQALRDAAERMRDAEEAGRDATRTDAEAQVGESRSQLEDAERTLREALAEATRDREPAIARAAERQQALAERARDAREAIRDAQRTGSLSESQAQGADQAMQRAAESMQQASEALQSGRQSQAGSRQQEASDALEQAEESLGRNRPLDDQERARLQQLADEQKRIEEDILKLAELVEQRQNRRAAESLRDAQRAAQRAQQAMRNGEPEQADAEQERTRQELDEALEALEEERDRYQDLRQEELLFRIKEELQQFLERQRPITQSTAEAGDGLRAGNRLTRPVRRQLNQLGEQEDELAGKARFIHEALAAEGTLVFTHVLEANESDLREVARRLGAREPDPGEFTVVLQRDVEARTEKLLEALERERQRRQEEQQREQQQQRDRNRQQNRFGPQQRRLVPFLSELRMLKQMEEEMLERTRQMDRLLGAAGADGVSETDLALTERLSHQHNALTGIFLKLKEQIESALSPADSGGGAPRDGERK